MLAVIHRSHDREDPTTRNNRAPGRGGQQRNRGARRSLPPRPLRAGTWPRRQVEPRSDQVRHREAVKRGNAAEVVTGQRGVRGSVGGRDHRRIEGAGDDGNWRAREQ